MSANPIATGVAWRDEVTERPVEIGLAAATPVFPRLLEVARTVRGPYVMQVDRDVARLARHVDVQALALRRVLAPVRPPDVLDGLAVVLAPDSGPDRTEVVVCLVRSVPVVVKHRHFTNGCWCGASGRGGRHPT